MGADLTIKRNDLNPALVLIAEDSVGPVDLTGAAAQFRMVNVLDGTTKVNAAAQVAASLPFTVSGATLSIPDHDLNNGERVTLKSTDTLPPGFSDEIGYYVINATQDTLQLSRTRGGTAVTTTGPGVGTHTLLSGRITYEWQGTDTDKAGSYFAEAQVTINSKPVTYPNGTHFLVEVISDLV